MKTKEKKDQEKLILNLALKLAETDHVLDRIAFFETLAKLRSAAEKHENNKKKKHFLVDILATLYYNIIVAKRRK